MTKLKLKVSRDILVAAKDCGGKSDTCAIARTVQEILPGAKVGPQSIFYYGEVNCEIPLPKSAIDFIRRFDQAAAENRPHLPEIEFEIRIPDEVIQFINIEPVRPGKSNVAPKHSHTRNKLIRWINSVFTAKTRAGFWQISNEIYDQLERARTSKQIESAWILLNQLHRNYGRDPEAQSTLQALDDFYLEVQKGRAQII